jgi:outer membrane murein-binding lipoprotein Lpp
MSFENFPAGTEPQQKPSPKKNDYRTILTGGLLVALLGTWGYIIWDKNKNNQKTQQLTTQISTSDSAKNELQTELNDATMRLDMLKTTNARADSLIKSKDKDIEDLKAKIQTIINNKNATASQLSEARALITQLKSNIDTYTAEIEKLQGEKIKLTEEKRVVTEERDVVTRNLDSAKTVITEKESVIDVGSTLHAFNFNIVGLHERGNKEKETSTARRVDKLRISFDLENRIAPSGSKDVFVCITAPNGTPVAVEALGSGKFVTRDGVEKLFTKKVQINYNQGEKQTVTVEWKQNSDFQTGNYKIEVYHNGFKIGEGVRNFKKGGLFG